MHPAPLGLALIASLGMPQDAPQQPKRIDIKLVIAGRVQIVQRDENGAVSQRRGFIEPSQLASINEAAKQAKAAIESAGLVQVNYHSLIDLDPYFVWFDPNRIWINNLGKPIDRAANDNQIFGKAMVMDMVEPWLNEEGFANQISPNYGPFNGAMLIHAGLTTERTNLTLHKMPVKVMSWNGFSQDDPQTAMAQEMADLATEAAGLPRAVIPTASTGGIGEFSTEVFNDPQFGSGQHIASRGIVARGGIPLGSGTGKSGYLNLRVRTKSNAPFSIVGLDESRKPIAVALLGDQVDKPLEAAPVPTTAYRLPTDNKWHQVSIPLEELGGSPAHIWFAMHPYAAGVEYPVHNPPFVDIASIEFKPAAAPDAIAKRELMASSAPVASDEPSLTAGVSSQSGVTRMASAWALTEVKAPGAVPALIKMAGSANPLETIVATAALAFQDTPEGWARLRELFFKNPFDANRRFAGLTLKGRLVATDVPDLSTAIASRSWRTRQVVLETAAPIDTRESDFFIANSLEDPYPQIRRSMSMAVSLREEMLLRRLIYNAVNDPSQYIREATFIRLLDVENELIRTDALKGVRDDAIGVRLGILRAMTASPKPHYRSALRQAVTDTSPIVRAAALEALTVQPDPVEPGEIVNTFSDADEGVQLALVKMAKVGQVILPLEVITTLKNSPHASVREAAKDLGGNPLREASFRLPVW